MLSFSRLQHVLGQALLLTIILINIFIINSPTLGLVLGLLYILLNSKILGDTIFPNLHKRFKDILAFVIILAYIGLNYTLGYHLYKINIWIFLWVLFSIPIITEYWSWQKKVNHIFFSNLDLGILRPHKIKRIIWPLATLALDIVLLVALSKNSYTGVLRSPWELVHYKFWLIFILSNVCLITSLLDKKSVKSLILIFLHLGLLSSIGIILYPLGFGYDSFIHLAVLENIEKTGTIAPRLFLYIGQYGLTLFWHDLSQISLALANKLLMPTLFSVLWPASIYYGLTLGLKWPKRAGYLSILWSLFLGFGFVTMTTPQSLAYLLVAMTVFCLPLINHRLPVYFFWILALLALTIHPLGGIPLFFVAAFLSLKNNLLRILLALASILSLPLFLAIYQRLNNIAWPQIFKINLWPLIPWSDIDWQQTYNFPLDMLHNIGGQGLWLYALICLIGILIIFKEHKYILFKKYLLTAAMTLFSYLLVKIFLNFNLQITYQKDDYPNRILFLLGITCLPLFLTSIYTFFADILVKNKQKTIALLLGLLTLLFVTIGVYFSYPIYDRHQNSKSFNVTQTDLKTVRFIEENASGQPYIVLANQMLGAAAIHEFGFAHYYNNNFYYSMPLGTDNIYSEYLEMVEMQATYEVAKQAMQKTGVDRVYLIVNNYWHSAKTALAQARQSANQEFLIDSGVNTIFLYQKKP